MRQCVRDIFVSFTSPIEGVVPYMYADVKGLITTGIGNLINSLPEACHLPWMRKDGTAATRDEIVAEWLRVKRDPQAPTKGHLYAKQITELRLTDAGVLELVGWKLDQIDASLAKRFPEYPEWPADAQLATLSLSWACGPAFRFPELERDLRSKDFAEAARDCHINEHGNPGVAPRNRANVALFRNAAKVVSFHLDPDALVWPSVLEEEPTQRELPNPASSPTIYCAAPDSDDAA